MENESWPSPTNHVLPYCFARVTGEHADVHASDIVENMLRNACAPMGSRGKIFGNQRVAIGWISPEKFSRLFSWSFYDTNSRGMCFVQGEFYDLPRDTSSANPGEDRLAAYLVEGFARNDMRVLRDLHGMFSGLYVRPGEEEVYFFIDPACVHPLYYHASPESLIITNNLWSFRCGAVPLKMDRQSVLEHLTVGPILDERSWIQGVRFLPMSSYALADRKNHVIVTNYAKEVRRSKQSIRDSAIQIREMLDDIVASLAQQAGGRVALSLSGGLDSRLILASVHAQSLDIGCYTYARSKDEVDYHAAEQISKSVGRQTTHIPIEPALAVAATADCVLFSEGETTGFGMLFGSRGAGRDCPQMLVGYAGDLIAGANQGPFYLHRIRSRKALANAILNAWSTEFSPRVAERLLGDDQNCSYADVKTTWNRIFATLPADTIPDLCTYFIMRYRVARRTRGRLDMARCYTLPLYPFVDDRVMDLYRSLPLEHLENERAHIAALGAYGLGLEQFPIAARWGLGIPIADEYRLRKRIHAMRAFKYKMLLPLQNRAREVMSHLPGAPPSLPADFGLIFETLEDSEILDGQAVRDLKRRAEKGTFRNMRAIRKLFCLKFVEDFLFRNRADLPVRPAILPVRPDLDIHRVERAWNQDASKN